MTYDDRPDGPDFGDMIASSARRRVTSWIRRRIVPIGIAVAVLAAIFFITIGASLPDDGDPINVSGDDAMSLVQKLQRSIGDAPGTKEIDITVTEQEVTSFLAIASLLSGRIEEAGGSGSLSEIGRLDPDAAIPADVSAWKDVIDSNGGLGTILTRGIDLGITITDPEVRFTGDGEIIVRGFGRIGPLSVPARAKVKPRVVDGDLEFEIIESQLGRLSLPGSAASLLSGGIERAILAGRNVASVTRIDVSDGVLRFAGTVTSD